MCYKIHTLFRGCQHTERGDKVWRCKAAASSATTCDQVEEKTLFRKAFCHRDEDCIKAGRDIEVELFEDEQRYKADQGTQPQDQLDLLIETFQRTEREAHENVLREQARRREEAYPKSWSHVSDNRKNYEFGGNPQEFERLKGIRESLDDYDAEFMRISRRNRAIDDAESVDEERLREAYFCEDDREANDYDDTTIIDYAADSKDVEKARKYVGWTRISKEERERYTSKGAYYSRMRYLREVNAV